MALFFNLKEDFYEDTSLSFFLSFFLLCFFLKQIKKGFFVFKGSAYILVGNFFFSLLNISAGSAS